jgi:hypothetical protein
MDDRQKIQDRLKKKGQEIQGLEERLRTARTYVTALQDILKLLGSNEQEREPPVSRTILRAGSSVDQARQAILKSGAPVHISALADAIGQDTREGRISLASSIAAYVRKGEIFTRPAPNTFGLVELGHKTTVEHNEGPPAGFGQLSQGSSPDTAEPTSQNGEGDRPEEREDIPF